MEAIVERAIVAIGRLYFMTLLNGRKRPVHLSRLHTLVDKCGLDHAKSVQAFTSLEKLRTRTLRDIIEEHAYFLSHCLSDNVPVIACDFDFTHIDECARPIIAYLTLNFQNLSPWANLEHFNRLLTGMRIPSSGILNVRILLHMYDYDPINIRKFRRDQYERLLVSNEEMNRVWYYRPRIAGKPSITDKIVAPSESAKQQAKMAAIAKLMVIKKEPEPKIEPDHVPDHVPKIEPEPKIEPNSDAESTDTTDMHESTDYEPKPGGDNDNFELQPKKRTSKTNTSRKRRATTYSDACYINYTISTNTVTGTCISDCFIYGQYVAIPTHGIMYSVTYPDIENILCEISELSSEYILGRFYLVYLTDLFQVNGVVSTNIDLSTVKKIIIRT